TCGSLRRSHPPGREASRPARAGADQVRTRRQLEDRQDAWHRSAAHSARPRRRGDRMKRREFILAFGGAAASIVRTQPVSAQQTRPVIGILGRTTAEEYAFLIAAFRKSLTEAGYVEGQNVTIEYPWADNRDDRLEAMASELVKKQVSVIFTSGGTAPTLAARAATSTIPIVFVSGTDPVAAGLVASISRPSGNVTGVSFLAP